MNTFVEIILIFLMLVLNGVFAMSEIAVLSARKLRLQQRAEDGDRGARAALELNENPNRFLSTVQIGITLISIFTGALGGATLAERLAGVLDTLAIPWMTASTAEGLSLAVVVLLTTYFSLVIGELIPKRLALGDPDKIARSVSPAMRILARLTAPIVQLLSWSTDLGLKLIGARDSDEPPVTEEEIKGLMEQGTQVGIFETAEQDMVSSVFRLGGRYVDALMTPRTEIEWIDLEEPFEEIRHQIIVSNHTRFPTGRGGLDNVQGVLLARDFLTRCMENSTPVDIEELLQPPLFVPDSMSALKVLQMLKDAGMHVALVIDEYGGLLGMVTLYDILKAIVGAIPQPGDTAEPEAIRREDGSWLLDGLMQVDDFKELLDLDELPDEDRLGYQTLGGFVMSQLGTIPVSGDHFEWQNLRFEVMDMDGRRVDKILVAPAGNAPVEKLK